MVFFEDSEHRLIVRDGNVMWSIVANKDKVLRKIERMELSKAATNLQPSMMNMAKQVLISNSPYIGIPWAFCSKLPTMKALTNRWCSEPGRLL